MYYKLYLLFIVLFKVFSDINKNKLIISLTSNIEHLNILDKIIYSVLEQNVNKNLYKILLILPKKKISKKIGTPKKLLLFFNMNTIRVVLLKNELNLQTRLIFAINEYPRNPILIVGSNILFPEGWLEMLIKDHKKYPNDVITCSIQLYFGQNLTIREFSEGFKGRYFGTFNHISNMIFSLFAFFKS